MLQKMACFYESENLHQPDNKWGLFGYTLKKNENLYQPDNKWRLFGYTLKKKYRKIFLERNNIISHLFWQFISQLIRAIQTADFSLASDSDFGQVLLSGVQYVKKQNPTFLDSVNLALLKFRHEVIENGHNKLPNFNIVYYNAK